MDFVFGSVASFLGIKVSYSIKSLVSHFCGSWRNVIIDVVQGTNVATELTPNLNVCQADNSARQRLKRKKKKWNTLHKFCFWSTASVWESIWKLGGFWKVETGSVWKKREGLVLFLASLVWCRQAKSPHLSFVGPLCFRRGLGWSIGAWMSRSPAKPHTTVITAHTQNLDALLFPYLSDRETRDKYEGANIVCWGGRLAG